LSNLVSVTGTRLTKSLELPKSKGWFLPPARIRFMCLRKGMQLRVIRLCDQRTELEVSLPPQVDMIICHWSSSTSDNGRGQYTTANRRSHRRIAFEGGRSFGITLCPAPLQPP